MSYKNGDFKKYFCEKLQRHYWVLGYFGGGPISFVKYKEVAEDFAKETKTPLEEVEIDEIFISRRFKGFKFIYATTKNQLPLEDSTIMADVWKWLND